MSVFLVASVTTIVPALGGLFYLLRRYEGYFEDARVFFSLIVGFFAGLVVAFLENVAFAFDSPLFVAEAGAGTAVLMFIGGYALVETAAKTVVLGAGKFRRRKDTPYYGAALGIGFGAMLALQTVALTLQRTALLEHAIDATWLLVFALVAIVGLGTVLTAGATGVWVGKGSAEGRLWRGLSQGAVMTMPLLACLWLFRQNIEVVPALLALAYGVGLVLATQRRVLDRIVPPEIRDQVRKERRRAQRRESAPAGPPSDPAGPEPQGGPEAAKEPPGEPVKPR